MVDTSNYYQRDPRETRKTPSERFPRNHVRYSALLKPLEWMDGACRLFGARAFFLKDAMLKEFDSAAPLDRCLGTDEELKRLRQSVELYSEGIDGNPFISPIGRYLGKTLTLQMMGNRRKVLQHYHDNKEFIHTKGRFEAPLIITGLPRSGTTLLQRLLSEDPNTRSPYTFEMEIPTPPLTSAADPLEDPRIKQSQGPVATMSRLARGFVEKLAESHLWSATEMEESLLYMLTHNGIPPITAASAGMRYLDALLEMDDKRPVFRYERLFFTMLDAYRPARSHWTLKAPVYALYFPVLLDEYSDARIVLTHRNPLVTMASSCRLMESFSIGAALDGSFDKHRFGQFMRHLLRPHVLRPSEYREAHPEDEERIFDCVYGEFFADPIAMVKKIYQRFGLEYTQEFEGRMRTYLQNNRQGKYGRHKYSLEEYGLDADALYPEYKSYMDRFGFEIPGKIERPVAFDFNLG